jgi:hypothetical protein
MKKYASLTKPASMRDSVERQLHLYTLAAGAAGVSVLALAQPGEAEIIYTPANLSISPNNTYSLDLTGDGTTDFQIRDTFMISNGASWMKGRLTAIPAQAGNAVLGSLTSGRSSSYASALKAGARIGSLDKFSPGNKVMAYGGYQFTTTYNGFCEGPWKNKHNHYLGLKFMISGEVHYGWARLTETCTKASRSKGLNGGENYALLTGYAYETIPNTEIIAGRTKGADDEARNGSDTPSPINAPDLSTLGMLAKGAPALSIWREP